MLVLDWRMRHRLYGHIVWTSRDRVPLISASVAEFLSRFLPAIASQERCATLALGMVTTHVHLLPQLHPATVIPRLMQRLKGGSAMLILRDGCQAITGWGPDQSDVASATDLPSRGFSRE